MPRTSIRLAVCVVLVAACGDDDGGALDGAPDGAPDGSLDAPTVDAGSDAAPAARIWAVGDFLTDTRRVAGAVRHDATLPLSHANPPAPVVPPGTVPELYDGANDTSRVFDARAGLIAYVADEVIIGRFGLSLANASGSGARMLLPGVTGTEIIAVAISPGGT